MLMTKVDKSTQTSIPAHFTLKKITCSMQIIVIFTAEPAYEIFSIKRRF